MFHMYLKCTWDSPSGDLQSDAIWCFWQWLRKNSIYMYTYILICSYQPSRMYHCPSPPKRKKNHREINNNVASQLLCQNLGIVLANNGSLLLNPLDSGGSHVRALHLLQMGHEELTFVNHWLSLNLLFSSFSTLIQVQDV